MTNPFDYQHPLDGPAELIDRQAELDELQRAAADRLAIRLASPRRYGKTSLLRAHLARMEEAGHHTCFIDFDRVATLPDVADRIVTGLKRLPADPARLMVRRMSRLGLSLGTSGLSVQLAPRLAPEVPTPDQARVAIRELLAVLGELAEDGTLIVVAMDEFQDLLTADDHVDGLFRSAMQHQRGIAYVFAGSSPTLMRELFADRERPFYGQARPLELPPLPDNDAFDHLVLRLPDHRDAPDAAWAAVTLAAGHPQRLMLLAHHLYDGMTDHPELDGAQLARTALDNAMDEVSDSFQSTWSGLDRNERAVTTAIADGLNPTSQAAVRRHEIARSTLQSATSRLEHGDQPLVHRDGSELVLLDPLFAEWLRRR